MKKIYLLTALLFVSFSIVAQSYRAIHLGGNWGYNFNYVTNTDPSFYPDDFIQFLHDTNVEWVGLSVSLHLDNSLDSTVELEYTGNIPTFTDAAITETLTWLRTNGFKTYVTLAFELEEPGSMEYPVSRWQLGDPYMANEDPNILAENWPWALDHPDHAAFVNSFFSSYAESAAHIAAICEDQGVEMFSIGTETERLFRTRSGGSWENNYLDGLLKITNSVREVYTGALTYDMTYEATTARDFFGAGSDYLWSDLNLDAVGISAYYQLEENPPSEILSEEHFLTKWQEIFDNYLIPLKRRNPDLPILFLEFGYTNDIESPYNPAASEFSDYVFTDSNNNGLDDGEEVQANIYSAFFKKLNENACIVEGAFLWGNEIIDQYYYDNDWNKRIHFGIDNKLVEDVVASTYAADHERPLPDMPLIAESGNIFNQGSQSVFDVIPVENAIRYNWSITPESIGVLTANETSVTIQWEDDASGEVEISVSAENGCGVSEKSSKHVYINSAPLDINIDKLEINENEEVGTLIGTLSTQDVDESDSFTYSISEGSDNFNVEGNELVSAVQFDFEESDSQTVRITSTDSNGLSTSKDFDIIVLDVEEVVLASSQLNEDISIFPNPTKDYIFIKWNLFENATITDLSGKIMFEQTDRTIDFKSLENGLYLIILQGSSEQVIFKVIKE